LELSQVKLRSDIPRSHSPGLPYKLQGFRTKGDCIQLAETKVKEKIESKGQPEFEDCMAHARSHLSEAGEDKVRAVWGYPMDMYLIEARFVYPLLDKMKTQETDIAFGYEMMRGGMLRVDRAARKHSYFVCLDWKMFDKTVPNFVIEDAFILAAELFEMTESDKMQFEWIKNYYIETPIRFSSGERLKKTGGIPSGTCFTSTINSIVNQIVCSYLFKHVYNCEPDWEKYMGDDSLFMFKKKFNYDVDVMAAAADCELSMIVNRKKSKSTEIRQEIEFLGYRNADGKPEKKLEEWLYSWMMPERTDADVFDALSRTLGLIYANGGVQLEFHELATLYIREKQRSWPEFTEREPKYSPSMERMLWALGLESMYHWSIPDRFDMLSRTMVIREPLARVITLEVIDSDDNYED